MPRMDRLSAFKRQAPVSRGQYFLVEGLAAPGRWQRYAPSLGSCFRDAGLLALTTLCLMPAGCATYHAAPLKPAAFQRQFFDRSLQDAGLRKFIARQPITPHPGFPRVQNLSTLVAAGWFYSPALRVQLAGIGVDEANVETASELPNPVAVFSPLYAAKAVPGTSPWVLGFSFDIPIETAGRVEDRTVQAKALARAGRYELGQIAWNVREGIRLAFINYIFAQKRILLLRQQVRNTAMVQSLIQSRFQAGDISQPIFTAAEIQAHEAALALLAALGLVRERRIQLATAMSLPLRALAGVRFSYANLMRLTPATALKMGQLSRAALMNRMDIQSLLAQYKAADAALKLQIARQYPNIQLGPGYSFDQGENKFTLGFDLAVPIFNQNQGAIAAAEAQRRVIAAELNQRQTMVITTIRADVSQYRGDLRQLRVARAIETQSELQLRAVRSAFKAGAQSRLALAEAQFTRNTFAQTVLQSQYFAAQALGNLGNVLEKPLENTPAMPKGTTP